MYAYKEQNKYHIALWRIFFKSGFGNSMAFSGRQNMLVMSKVSLCAPCSDNIKSNEIITADPKGLSLYVPLYFIIKFENI